WPERRPKDPLFANENGPGIGIIDRITVDSYLDVSEGYIPDYLRPLVGAGRRLFPFIGGSDYSVKIGPFPKGMPIGLITNIDLLGSELPPEQQKQHQQRLLTLFKHAKSQLKSGADIGTALKGLVEEMLAVSKCKDLV